LPHSANTEELGAGQARDDVIDLHGLHIAEAIEYIEKIIEKKRPGGCHKLRQGTSGSSQTSQNDISLDICFAH
jgi:hypothetical protein